MVPREARQRSGKEPEPQKMPCLLVEIGAGEGIRTLDPDLGKVVLYP